MDNQQGFIIFCVVLAITLTCYIIVLVKSKKGEMVFTANNRDMALLLTCPVLLSLVSLFFFGCSRGSSKQNQMVTCPMCGGTGIFCLMPDDLFAPRSTCSACNGTGMCTAEQANNIREAIHQTNSFMNGNGMDTPHCSGRSAYEIRRDLDKAYRLLDDMERQYRECSSVTIAAQYPSMI